MRKGVPQEQTCAAIFTKVCVVCMCIYICVCVCVFVLTIWKRDTPLTRAPYISATLISILDFLLPLGQVPLQIFHPQKLLGARM